MEQKNLFQDFSSVIDEDENFEPGELVNFDIDKIAAKPVTDLKFDPEEFSDEALLTQFSESDEFITDENNLKSLFNFFEN